MIFLIVNLVLFVLYDQQKIDRLDRLALGFKGVRRFEEYVAWLHERTHLILVAPEEFAALMIVLLPLNLLLLLLSGAGPFGLMSAPLLVAYLYHKQCFDAQAKRRREILADYQQMLQYATLHLLAGNPLEVAVRRAIAEMVTFSASEKKDLVLSGRGVMAALRRESTRVRLVEVRRLVHYLAISFEKGEAQAYQALYNMGQDFFKMRMNHARKRAQEMNQALLLPIMMIFLAILALLVAPSLLTLLG